MKLRLSDLKWPETDMSQTCMGSPVARSICYTFGHIKWDIPYKNNTVFDYLTNDHIQIENAINGQFSFLWGLHWNFNQISGFGFVSTGFSVCQYLRLESSFSGSGYD